MLSATEARQARQARRRPPPSLMQQYQEYVLQRIEGFKNSIARDDLLRLGDEAVSEMQSTSEGQFVLTEVLMLESVDRLIMKRLAIRSYRRWRQQFLRLRAAQREPNHWGLDADCPLVPLLPRIEGDDQVLVVAAEPMAYLLAAYDAAVTFIDADLNAVERVERRMADESLASLFCSYLVQPGGWLPEFDGALSIVVIDVGALVGIRAPARADFLRALQAATGAGGVHVLLPGSARLAPEALLTFYEGWAQDDVARSRRRGSSKRRAIVLARAEPAADTLDHAAAAL